jgi:phosphatidylinositol glycan class V
LTVYTEQTFALLSWTGLYFIENCEAHSYSLIGCIPLILASLTRSNGNFISIFIIAKWLQSKSLEGESHWRSINSNDIRSLLFLVSCNLPYVMVSYMRFHMLCADPSEITSSSGDTQEFCSTSSFLFVYSYIQRKYWNVGFLRYFQLKQLPNFLLALPICLISIYTVVHGEKVCRDKFSKDKHLQVHTLGSTLTSFSIRALHRVGCRPFATIAVTIQTMLGHTHHSYCPHALHLLALLLVGLLMANVQITTRLLCSSCPIIYVTMAHLTVKEGQKEKGEKEAPKKAMAECPVSWEALAVRRRWVVAYIALYNLVGLALHVNNYPWT